MACLGPPANLAIHIFFLVVVFFLCYGELLKCRPFPQENTDKYSFDTTTELL